MTTLANKPLRYQMFVDGRWTDPRGGGSYAIPNPATEETVGYAPNATREDMRQAIAAARKAFDEGPWPRMTPRERHRVLMQFSDALARRRDLFRQLLVEEAGAEHNLHKFQVDAPPIFMANYAELALRWEFQEILPPSMRHGAEWQSTATIMVNHQPAGVCGVIPTWNFPLYVTVQKIGPALATGCTVVVKPAPYTPLTGLEIAKAAAETDLPPGVFNVVTGESPDLGEELVVSPLVDKVSFTGSIPTGKRIMELGARTLKRLTLELGGKSASIVLDDADIDHVAPHIAFSPNHHAGQGCGALSRCLLPEKLYERMLAAMVAYVRAMKVGNPADPTVVMGPLIREERRLRVEEYIAAGISQGAELVTGGKRPSHLRKGYFLEPTVFSRVRNDMRIAQEEIFGPVLSVIPYKTVEEAIQIANDSRYGLSGAVFTKDKARGIEVARRIRTGVISVGGYEGSRGSPLDWLYAPFGGFKESGLGREGGMWGMRDFTEPQTITW